MRALIADDDRTTTAIVGAALRRWNFDVTIAHDGSTAWELLLAERPPLAILDWMMPELDGPELCRRIRRDPTMVGTYVILLTCRDAVSDRVAGLDAGADDYIVKPFASEELRARVQVGARVAALQAQLADQVAELQRALATVKQLEGLLPICGPCKRIRSDDDSWESLEACVRDRTAATFTQSVCPSCFKKAMESSAT